MKQSMAGRLWWGRAGIVAVSLALLGPGTGWAQAGIDGPPACPVAAGGAASHTAATTVPAKPGEERPGAQALAMEERGAADASMLVAAEPLENFGITRLRLRDYGDCAGGGGCYWRDLDAQFQRAERTLAALVKAHAGEPKLAVVIDIDETTLSGYCEMKHEDFGYISPMFNDWVVSPEATVAIPGSLRLYRQARAAGLAVIFLTGRPEEQREATERNLHAVGIESWARLLLRSPEEKGLSATEYKTHQRGRMMALGYKLILNVGDQWSDLMGAPQAEVSVKLPNPFYFLP